MTSLDSFERYHEKDAEVWERQILLRARPCVGPPELATRFDTLRRNILSRPLPDDFAAESHHIRQRMETELAGETEGRWDVKTGRGGLLDVETSVQFLQLRHGGEHGELFDVRPTRETIDRLESLELLSEAHARVLREGWSSCSAWPADCASSRTARSPTSTPSAETWTGWRAASAISPRRARAARAARCSETTDATPRRSARPTWTSSASRRPSQRRLRGIAHEQIGHASGS